MLLAFQELAHWCFWQVSWYNGYSRKYVSWQFDTVSRVLSTGGVPPPQILPLTF